MSTMSAPEPCPACGKHEAHASKVFDLIDEARRNERERIIALLGDDMVVVPYGWCSSDHILSTEDLRAFLAPKA